MTGTKYALGLPSALKGPLPPEADQLIVYGVETRGEHANVLHNGRCLQKIVNHERDVTIRETTGKHLRQKLKDEQLQQVCIYCFSSGKLHATALIRDGETDQGFNWADCSLMLHYEAHHRQRMDAWISWLNLEQPEVLRERAQKSLRWTEATNWAVWFDAGGCSDSSWVVGAGDHVVVKRHDNRTTGFAVHGIIPWPEGAPTPECIIPVEKGFTKAHLDLAVSLYEADEIVLERYWVQAGEAAKKAIETTMLCVS